MEIKNLPFKTSELKALLRKKEKYYYDAIKDNVDFDKLKPVQESIRELRQLLSTKEDK